MTTNLAATANPTSERLLVDFGDEYLSIQSLFQFCFVPGGRLNLLKELTVHEQWGVNNFVLLKYLAVHVRLAIEQGRFSWNKEQIVLTAGRLTTTGGAPIYLGLVKNSTPDENPWVLNWVGERPSCADLPEPADLGHWPALEPGKEVVIAVDLGAEDREALPGLGGATPIAQTAALVGAISWSIRRDLAVRQIHGGGRGWFVPIHLTARDDLTAAPDLVAPMVVQDERLVVRAVLEPHVAYSPARSVVDRWEQLPAWLLDAWDDATQGEDSEGSPAGAPTSED